MSSAVETRQHSVDILISGSLFSTSLEMTGFFKSACHPSCHVERSRDTTTLCWASYFSGGPFSTSLEMTGLLNGLKLQLSCRAQSRHDNTVLGFLLPGGLFSTSLEMTGLLNGLKLQLSCRAQSRYDNTTLDNRRFYSSVPCSA